MVACEAHVPRHSNPALFFQIGNSRIGPEGASCGNQVIDGCMDIERLSMRAVDEPGPRR